LSEAKRSYKTQSFRAPVLFKNEVIEYKTQSFRAPVLSEAKRSYKTQSFRAPVLFKNEVIEYKTQSFRAVHISLFSLFLECAILFLIENWCVNKSLTFKKYEAKRFYTC